MSRFHPKVEWYNTKILRFIKYVEKLPMLWDPKNPYYKVNKKKEYHWRYLGKVFKCDHTELKRKWLSLRASYRREKMKRMLDEGKTRSWFAFDALHFLPQNESEKLAPMKLKENEDIDEIEDHEDIKLDIQINDLPEDIKTEPEEICFSRMSEESHSEYEVSTSKHSEEKDDYSEEKDEYALFGEYIATKLRKMGDERSKVTAQYKINNIIYEAELGMYKGSAEAPKSLDELNKTF